MTHVLVRSISLYKGLCPHNLSLQNIAAYCVPNFEHKKRGDGCKKWGLLLFTLHLRGFVIVTGTILSASKSGLMFNIGISFSKRDRSNGLESATKFAGSILNLENFNERDLPEGMAFDFLVPGIKISASLPALFVNLM